MEKSKKTVYKCKHCPKEFKKSSSLEKHMLCHAMPKEFKCASCDSLFYSAAKLKCHIDECHVKIECNLCGEVLQNEASYKKHLDKHMSANFFKCAKCEKSFKHLRNLKCHEKTHFGEKPLICKVCKKSFSTSVALENHKLTHLVKKQDLNHKTKSVKNSPRLKNLYPCSICAKKFSVCAELRKHEAMHTCNNTNFRKISQVVKNSDSSVKTNTVHKQFKCTSCESSYNSAIGLNNHIARFHFKIELLDCCECGDSFVNEASYNDHMATHTLTNQFKCDKCNKSFKHLKSLKHHKKSHVKEKKPLPCKLCEKSFSDSVALEKHIADVHLSTLSNKVNIKSPRKKDPNPSIALEKKLHTSELGKCKATNTSKDTDFHNYLMKIVETSNSAVESTWCHLCNIDLNSSEDFRLHIFQKHKSVSDFDKTHKTILQGNKSVDECAKQKLVEKKNVKSPSKRGEIKFIQQSKKDHVKNIRKAKQPNTTIEVPNMELNATNVEATTQTVQNPANINTGHPFIFNLSQPQQNNCWPAPGITFSIVQSPYHLMNVPNMQWVTVNKDGPPREDSVPEFNFDSENYISWLKAFVEKCKSQTYPLPPTLAKNIRKVSQDLFDALINPEGSLKRKENHFYILKFHQTISDIMLGQAKYYLAPRCAANIA